MKYNNGKENENNEDEECEDKNHYQDKENLKILYSQLKTLYDLYVNDESLKDMHLKFDMNKKEYFNKLVIKFVPKTSYLCGSIASKAHVYVAASIDSIGYVSFYYTLYSILGVKYPTPLY